MEREQLMPEKIKTARLAVRLSGRLSFTVAVMILGIFLYAAIGIGLSREEQALLGSAVLGSAGVWAAVLSVFLGIIFFIVDKGISRGSRWARIAGIVLGLLMLPLFPVGTVFGILILSGLLAKDARPWFETSWGSGRFR